MQCILEKVIQNLADTPEYDRENILKDLNLVPFRVDTLYYVIFSSI